MRKALRPCVTVGVALVGASAIAVAPVVATPADVKIANPDVQFSVSPLEKLVDALQTALDDVEAVIGLAVAGQTSPLTTEEVLGALASGLQAALVPPRANLAAVLGEATGAVQHAAASAEAGDIPAAVTAP